MNFFNWSIRKSLKYTGILSLLLATHFFLHLPKGFPFFVRIKHVHLLIWVLVSCFVEYLPNGRTRQWHFVRYMDITLCKLLRHCCFKCKSGNSLWSRLIYSKSDYQIYSYQIVETVRKMWTVIYCCCCCCLVYICHIFVYSKMRYRKCFVIYKLYILFDQIIIGL